MASRIEYPSIKDAAAEVLRGIAAEGVIKEAERQLLQDAEHPRTDVGSGLCKLAAELRRLDDDDPEVTYADLRTFVTQCSR